MSTPIHVEIPTRGPKHIHSFASYPNPVHRPQHSSPTLKTKAHSIHYVSRTPTASHPLLTPLTRTPHPTPTSKPCSQVKIAWVSNDLPTTADVAISVLYKYAEVGTIIATTPNSGSYDTAASAGGNGWTVPSSFTLADSSSLYKYEIQVTAIATGAAISCINVYKRSTPRFPLYGAVLTDPAPGVVLETGQTYEIAWDGPAAGGPYTLLFCGGKTCDADPTSYYAAKAVLGTSITGTSFSWGPIPADGSMGALPISKAMFILTLNGATYPNTVKSVLGTFDVQEPPRTCVWVGATGTLDPPVPSDGDWTAAASWGAPCASAGPSGNDRAVLPPSASAASSYSVTVDDPATAVAVGSLRVGTGATLATKSGIDVILNVTVGSGGIVRFDNVIEATNPSSFSAKRDGNVYGTGSSTASKTPSALVVEAGGLLKVRNGTVLCCDDWLEATFG